MKSLQAHSAIALSFALCVSSHAQGKRPAPKPYSNDFQAVETGELPDGMMEIDGVFTVTELDGGAKVLEMAAEPLAENAVLFGSSIKGGATVQARVLSFKKRRSYPRFGIGLHGISGFRLRVTPAKKQIELVKNEEPVKSFPFDWKADAWLNLQLSITADGENWKIEGRAWADGADRPEKATIALVHEGAPGQGKASLWGTAYSGKVAQFDDVKMTPAPAE